MEGADTPPQPIHLGLRAGIVFNRVALNLRLTQADIKETLQRLADDLLPDFPPLDHLKAALRLEPAAPETTSNGQTQPDGYTSGGKIES